MRTSFPEPKYFIFSRATEAVRKMVLYYNRVLSPLGLTAQQMMALGVLWREEGISLGTFAKRLGTGKAAATSMVKRLRGMGLVTCSPNPRDGRLNVLTLTDKARRLAPEVAEKVRYLEKRIEAAVGHKHMQTLIMGLSAIRDLDM